MVSPCRVAVVGWGAVAEDAHGPALARRDDVEVVAVVEPSPERRAAAIRRLGLKPAQVPSTVEELVASTAVDLAVITSPTPTHCAAIACLTKAGIRVLCEKPLAPTAAEAGSAVDAGDEHLVGVVHSYACRRDAVAVAAAASRGGGLTPQIVRCRRFDPSPATGRGADPYWRAADVRGPWLDLGYHYVYLAELFLGSPVVSVSEATTAGSRGTDGAATAMAARLSHASGATSEIEVGWGSGGTDVLEVLTNDGVLRLEPGGFEPPSLVTPDGGRVPLAIASSDGRSLHDRVYGDVLGQASVIPGAVPFGDGLHVLEVIDAVVASSGVGGAVTVPVAGHNSAGQRGG